VNEIWLIRHGVTRANRLGVIQGQSPEPLSSTGREQARKLGRWLAVMRLEIDALISSPLARAAQTAAIVARHLSVDESAIDREPRLAERSFGELEGRSSADAYGEQEAAGDPRTWRPPGGESFVDLEARVAGGFASIAERPGERALVVTHGGPIVALTCRHLDLELAPARFGRLRCDNTGVTILRRDATGEFGVLTFNARFHL
jgi:broad specificity phosphatase PhoE